MKLKNSFIYTHTHTFFPFGNLNCYTETFSLLKILLNVYNSRLNELSLGMDPESKTFYKGI